MSREEVLQKLGKPLDPSRVRQRDAGRGRQVPYIEGHDAITTANDVFGFDGWSYRVEDVNVLVTGQGRLLYRAVVTVEAIGVKRTDLGSAIVEVRRDTGEDSPDGHDMAIKGAVTDGLKRALRTFGAQFGNELYDKTPPAANTERSAPATNGAAPDRPSSPTAEVARTGTIGDFFAWAWREHKLNKTAVLKLLELKTSDEITDIDAARERVQAVPVA